MTLSASESDIIRSLDKRVAELENRVRQLEAHGGTAIARADPCPNCGGRLRLSDETDHPTYGIMGIKVRTFTCEGCGRRVTRDYDPSNG